MKVAIVHDYIKEYGGAERVLESLHEVFPDAQVYTSIYLPSFLGPHRERFKNWKINTSWFQDIPFKSKLISPLRILAPFIFQSLDLSKFDVVIVSQTGAYTPNLIKKGKAIQICYSHTPPRYLYGYATAREWKKNMVLRVLGEIANHFLRLVDYKSSQNVDYFIANSRNIASRIEKFYRRSSTVIYPPVDISSMYQLASIKNTTDTKYIIHNTKYFLAGGRIAKPKHIDLIVKTFEELKLPLKVFGRGFAGAELKSSKSNIEFLGEVSDEEKYALMAGAKAYVFAAKDEDFGITPVEAMVMGTPVIAYRSGGVLETVIEGKTGLFFDELSVKSLSEAIRKLGKARLNHDIIRGEAQKFSKERFQREIKEFINEKTHIKN